MKDYSIEPDDIKEAVKEQNFVIAPGLFGQNSDQAFETVIKYTGKFTSVGEFEDIVVKTNEDGTILRLKDVARIEVGPNNARNENRVKGLPLTTMDITQNINSNARQVDVTVRLKIEELSKDLPKGVKYNISY